LSWEQGGGKTLGAAGYALGSVPLTGEEIAEIELQAAWENTGKVIPFAPRHRPMAPIKPLRETEQLELFAA
jgi:hypothetical protein